MKIKEKGIEFFENTKDTKKAYKRPKVNRSNRSKSQASIKRELNSGFVDIKPRLTGDNIDNLALEDKPPQCFTNSPPPQTFSNMLPSQTHTNVPLPQIETETSQINNNPPIKNETTNGNSQNTPNTPT